MQPADTERTREHNLKTGSELQQVSLSELAKFTPKQLEATQAADTHRYTLYGGARGGGKSHWLRYYLLRLLLRWYAETGLRGIRVMLACENYPALRDRQIVKIEAEFPAWLGTLYNPSGAAEFRLHPKYGGGVIALRNLDDPSKYQSTEFAAIGIDEVSKNPERTFHILRGSLRWPGIEDVRVVATTNPENNWIRDYWIERKFPTELLKEADEFVFVPALPTDNPYLSQSYWDMLATLPGALREAWLDGNWYVGVEGIVYENFTAENIVDMEPDAGRPYELAIDDGYIDPRATLFIQSLPGGAILVFDELYEHKTLEEVTIEHIGDKAGEYGMGKPQAAVASHEAVALRARLNDADMPAVNWLASKVGGGKSTRLAALTLTRSMICDGQGVRNLFVHRRCRNLLNEIQAGYKYPEGRHGLEAAPTDGNDHACQALESWIWSRYSKADPSGLVAFL